MTREKFDLSLNEHRKNLIDRAEKEILPQIDKRSTTAALVVAMEKGLEWCRIREEKLKEIEEEERQLEEKKRQWKI
jgi:outer membrane scaffolding protein for murein synthesis (MipA/OmpV family)